MTRTIFVDIDDTICSSDTSLNYELASPFPDRIEKINALYDSGNIIVYWTARGTKTGIPWYHLTKSQLDSWGCKYHELRMGKPAYDLFIDDKNIESNRFFSEN